MKKVLLTAVMAVIMCMTAVADGKITFTACALNVDGMPNNVLGYNLNGDGPGESGSVLIGQYLRDKGFDIIGVSENFNYNNTIFNEMSGSYNQGYYRGGMSFGSNGASFSNMRFDTDGLNIFVKNIYGIGPSAEGYDVNWQLWSHQAGSVSDGDGGQYDELVKKGFRYYEVTLKAGFIVDVFVLHMDAGSRYGDSGTDVDGADAQARNDQLLQLKDYILNNKNNGRPKIVIGDTNCRYTRDKVKANFVNPVEESGLYTVRDAWVELLRNNVYPTYNTASLVSGSRNSATNEIVDKIIYLNPTSGTRRIHATQFNVDESYDLGDHMPVVVTFQTEGAGNIPADQSTWWRGEDPTGVEAGAHQYYIYNVGRKVFSTDATTAYVADIHEAVRWGRWSVNGNEFTISRETGWRFKDGEVDTGSGARKFSVIESTNTSGARNLQWKTLGSVHWFGIDDNGSYNSGDNSNSVNKDWLFISQEQKDAYDEYVAAYNNARTLTSLASFSRKDELQTLLANADGAHANYSNCNGANGFTAPLKAIYDAALREYKAYVSYDANDAVINRSFEDEDMSAWTYNTAATDAGRREMTGVFAFTATDGANLGSYTFNTWSGDASHLHYVWQKTATPLLPGYYILKAYVATDREYITEAYGDEQLHNRYLMYLTVNDCEYSIVVDRPKEQGVPYEMLFYHKAGRMTIGANSDNTFRYWFKVDEFSLTRYDDQNILAVPYTTLSTGNAQVESIYTANGMRTGKLQRGINFVRMNDGTVRKIIVK